MIKKVSIFTWIMSLVVSATLSVSAMAFSDKFHEIQEQYKKNKVNIELGPRPFYLVEDMDPSPLKEKLANCRKKDFKKSDFSIGHRGAALQFPEHTKESYVAAAQMGAGIVECDVTFTEDKELVCRHSQCDLHTTTNILETPLAAKCSQAFEPATYDSNGNLLTPAKAQCCTSDITLAEFKTLKGKMDAFDPTATNVSDYMKGTANWRTDLYSERGTLMTHKDSIALFKELKVKMTPELKSASVSMPFNGFSQQDYAQKMINEYKEMGVPAQYVFAQSFDINDVYYWIENEPEFGKQAVYLDGRYDNPEFNHRDPATWTPSLSELVEHGVNIVAPPMWMLVEANNGKIVPSYYAEAVKNSGLDIIAWTFERSGLLANGGGWYYQTLNGTNLNPQNPQSSVINNDGDKMELIHVLANDIGIKGLFSDWPAAVTYYANCMNLR